MPIDEKDLGEDGTVEEPINHEDEIEHLVSSFLTKSSNYDRNHGKIQHKLADEHVVEVVGTGVTKPLKLKVTDLVGKFPQHRITCALQCAGNRRNDMRTRTKEVNGVNWFDGAIMNCVWEGPRLRDVLEAAGVTEQGDGSQQHVQFASYSNKTQEDDWYGGSIPFNRAIQPEMDVILAVKMNGEPLPARHGFPVRAIVPGVVGARSVKWLDRITVSEHESPNHYQTHDYKILPPEAIDAESAEKYWDTTPAMLDMPVNACVAVPQSGSKIVVPSSGLVAVSGYAVPQGAQGPVVRVQVSGNDGASWVDAELDDGGENATKWSWVLFKAEIEIPKGSDRTILAKATDAGGNTQDARQSQWNLRGVGYNGQEAVWNLTVV